MNSIKELLAVLLYVLALSGTLWLAVNWLA